MKHVLTAVGFILMIGCGLAAGEFIAEQVDVAMDGWQTNCETDAECEAESLHDKY